MGNEQSSNEYTEETSLGKHANGGVNGLAVNISSNGLDVTSNTIGTQQNGAPPSLISNKESNEGDCVIIEPESQIAGAQAISGSPDSTDQKNLETDSESHATSENHKSTAQEEEAQQKKGKKVSFFGNIFKKTTEPPSRECDVEQDESSTVDQTDAGAPVTDSQFEAADIKQDAETFKEPKSVSLDPSPEEGETQDTGKENNQLVENEEESHAEENPVMNFFKTLGKPTKTPKTETTTPDATKDQLQKEIQPAAATTAAQVADPPAAPKGMSIPPPPPPEPPKMEIKGEIAAKPVMASPKAEPKAAAKDSKAAKGTFSVDTLTKFFRPKALLGKRSKAKGVSTSGAKVPAKTASGEVEEVLQPVVEVQPVEAAKPVEEAAEPLVEILTTEEEPLPDVEVQKADASKASTLEAAAKPEVAPTAQEDKKNPSKPSAFLSFFKPKVLLNQMASKVNAASTSGVQLLRKTTGVAAEPKKKDTPPPPVAAEAAQTVKAKEDPKAPEAPADKSGPSQESPNVPRKLEKRNSIHLFFKNLSQKRNSTDAGIQTEQVTTAPAAEKAK